LSRAILCRLNDKGSNYQKEVTKFESNFRLNGPMNFFLAWAG